MTIDLTLFFTTDEESNQTELPRPETKSWSDVTQCIEHHQGNNASVVDRFIELACLGDQWDWYEAYKDWQANCEQITVLNDSRVPDEETGELPEPYPLPEMPVRPNVADKLPDLKKLKLEQVRLWADSTLRQLTDSYPGHEVITWDKQEQESFALQQDAAATTVMLDGISAGRGLDKTELASRVLANSEAFSRLCGEVLGRRQALEDAIGAAGSVEELMAVAL